MFLLQSIFAGVAFLCGAIPFSVLVGRYGMGKDIRDYGDGNPGTFNVIRAGGIKWGGLAMILDIGKGAVPVGLATYVFGWEGLPLILTAIAPVAGHAFSPFLNFNGGKAIATTMGIWIGLTLWEVPLVGLVSLTVFYLTLTSSAWAVVFTALVMFAYLLVSGASSTLLIILMLNAAIVFYKHRRELDHLPTLRILNGQT